MLLERLSVERIGPGGPRTRPDHLLADQADSSQGHRAMLRQRGISHTIPERQDEKTRRRERGSNGGRPPKFDAARYTQPRRRRTQLSQLKQWRGLSQRSDKLAINYAGG